MGVGTGLTIWLLIGIITVDFIFNEICQANIVHVLCGEFFPLPFCNIHNIAIEIVIKIQLIIFEATNRE